MAPMTDCGTLQSDLGRALVFFSTDAVAKELPFAHSFPKNCCERSAALLTVALANKYCEAKVLYVKGRNPRSGKMHFWVEVESIVLDVTAHQFDGFDGPLICPSPSPLEATFAREAEVRNPEAETDLAANSNGRWHDALARLREVIEA